MEPVQTATRSALARQCVRCGLCLPHCPTYGVARTEAESPRGRIALMAVLAEQSVPSGPHPALDACLGCRRCEAVCPAGVAFDELLLLTRAAVPPHIPRRGKIVLWLMRHKSWLNAGLRLYRRIFPALPAAWRRLPRPAKPKRATRGAGLRAGSAVFSGCVADTFEAEARQALLRLLQAAGEAAAVPDAQGCCGQAARHAGQAEHAARLGAANRAAFAGFERVLMLASGCHDAVADSLPVPVLDAAVFLSGHARKLAFRSARGRRVALHTPCSAGRHDPQRALRQLLARIPDLELVLLPDSGCCGAAGLHQLADPARAAALRAPLAAAIAEAGVDTVLSQNIGCRLHLSGAVEVAVRHPLEFMAEYLHDA